MAYFPMFMDLTGAPCLVVGGGRVAAGKVCALCSFGARVTVIAPSFSEELLRMAESAEIGCAGECSRYEGTICLVNRAFTPADPDGMRAVVAATDDAAVNEQVSRLCREKNIPVNVVDQKDLCTFAFPAIHRQDDLVVAVSTGGNSPAMAAYLKKQIAEFIPEVYGKINKEMGEARAYIRKLGTDGTDGTKGDADADARSTDAQADAAARADVPAGDDVIADVPVRADVHTDVPAGTGVYADDAGCVGAGCTAAFDGNIDTGGRADARSTDARADAAARSGASRRKAAYNELLELLLGERTLRIGSRTSALALAQTDLFIERLHARFPEISCRVVLLKTLGDRLKDRPLKEMGGKGVFVEVMEDALRDGTIDCAVHSAKDLPSTLPEDMRLACVCARGNPGDVLVLKKETAKRIGLSGKTDTEGRHGRFDEKDRIKEQELYGSGRKNDPVKPGGAGSLENLYGPGSKGDPAEAGDICTGEGRNVSSREKFMAAANAIKASAGLVIGTGSPRREAVLKNLFPRCKVKGIRGNVPTRLTKLREGGYDALVLAEAGLARIGLDQEEDLLYIPIPTDVMVPAGGQGTIAVEAKALSMEFLGMLSDEQAAAMLEAERRILRDIGADCHTPVGVYAREEGGPDKVCIDLWLAYPAAEQADCAEHTEGADCADRAERTEGADCADRADRADRAEGADRTEGADCADGTNYAACAGHVNCAGNAAFVVYRDNRVCAYDETAETAAKMAADLLQSTGLTRTGGDRIER